MRQIKTIGLVGGVASGKSLAAKYLVEFGAVLLDADQTGHLVLADDTDVRQAVLDRWGQSVLGPHGKIDRAAIARKVFSDGEAATSDRKFLENLLHPRIGRRLEQQRDQAAAAGKPAVVLDAPLLLEAGWGSMCDFVIMIDSPRESRLARAATRGWTEAEFAQREAAQWSTEEKRGRADLVIANRGTADDLRQSVANFWAQYIVPPASKP